MIQSRPIRVALRIEDGPVAAYRAAAADSVVGVSGTELCLVMCVRPTRTPHHDLWGRARDLLSAPFNRLEWAFMQGGPAALAGRMPGPWPAGTTVAMCDTPDEQAVAVAKAQPDLVIDLVAEDAGVAPPIPHAGWWRIRFAAGVGGERGPTLSRPRRSRVLAESLLSITTPDGRTHEAEVGVSALGRVGFGPDASAVYWRGSQLPARHLARVVADPEPRSDRGAVVEQEARPAPADPEPPRALPAWVQLLATIGRKVLHRAIYRTIWTVFVRPRGPGTDVPSDLTGFTAVAAPVGRFYADPFVVQTGDTTRLYVEDCPVGTHRGRISTLVLDADGGWSMERIVLADLPHRAYPHALRTEQGLVLTPDGGASDGVDIFLDHEDTGAVRISRCLDGMAASDPTLLVHDGRYWLFVALAGHGMASGDELHLYSATSPAGPWEAHPRNPIVADVRRARPAGRILQVGERLLRPGQDCSVLYGGRITWSAIAVLSREDYEEYPIGSVEPRGIPGVSRTHTYSADGAWEALDGYMRVPRWWHRDKGAA